MIKSMRKLTALFALLAMCSMLFTFNVCSADDEIKLQINGDQIEFPDQQPYLRDGVVFVPIRQVFDALNLKIIWNGETETITTKTPNGHFVLRINSRVVNKNLNSAVILDAPVKITNGRTMIPLSVLTNIAGVEAKWAGVTKTVTITNN